LELGNGVFILICELPPVRAQLADVANRVFLQTVGEQRELLVNLGQVLQIELDVFAEFQGVC